MILYKNQKAKVEEMEIKKQKGGSKNQSGMVKR
jgi:hypothetical protein